MVYLAVSMAPSALLSYISYLLARPAVPDPRRMALDAVLAAEGALVLGVLGHLDLLDLLAQRCTVAVILPVSLQSPLRSLQSVSGLVRSRGR